MGRILAFVSGGTRSGTRQGRWTEKATHPPSNAGMIGRRIAPGKATCRRGPTDQARTGKPGQGDTCQEAASIRANSSGSMRGMPSWAAFLALLVVVSEVTRAVVLADTLLLAEPPRASIRSLTVVRV